MAKLSRELGFVERELEGSARIQAAVAACQF